MIGQTGTEQMSGVAIVNQILLIFNLAVFGAVSGAGIFTAQYYGCKDHEGVRNTFRFKLIICAVITAIGILILAFFGGDLISLFLKGDDAGFSKEDALKYGTQYLLVMLVGLAPFALEQAYSSTLRECGETVVSMKAGVVAILVNLVLNYILIFGKLGAPELGVMGAAVATVISRYVQMIIVIVWTHRHSEAMPFIKNAYRKFHIPMNLVGRISIKGIPLMFNEILWAAGMAMLNQSYSLHGMDAVSAISIASTLSNLYNVVFIALGDSIAIIVGQQLGRGDFEGAKDTDRKMITFSVLLCIGLGVLLAISAPFFPLFYDTTSGVRSLATSYMFVSACYTPIWGCMHAMYFTLRSGGNTFITFLFDSAVLWVIIVPVAYVLSRMTSIALIPMYAIIESTNIAKAVLGYCLIKKGVWLNNIVDFAEDN